MLKNNIELCSKLLTFNPKGSRSSDLQTPIRAIKQKRKIVISTAKRVDDRQKATRYDTETGSKYPEDKENSQRYMNCFDESELPEHSHFYMETSRDFGYEHEYSLQYLVERFKNEAQSIHKGFMRIVRVATRCHFEKLKHFVRLKAYVKKERRNTNEATRFLEKMSHHLTKLCMRTFMGCLHTHASRMLDEETRTIELYYRKRYSEIVNQQKMLAARMLFYAIRQVKNRKHLLCRFVCRFPKRTDCVPKTSGFCLPAAKPREHHKSYSFSAVDPY